MEDGARKFKTVFIAGAVSGFAAVALGFADIAISMITGSSLANLPESAADFFALFAANPWLGLYNLDLLNVLVATFVPGVEDAAMIAAMVGGLAIMAWMVMYSLRLLKLAAMDRS